MTLTKAQRELLREMENGWEVRFHAGNYRLTKDGELGNKLWPSTFYGLYDNNLVERLNNGYYTISNDGKRKILGADK
jgi:hypothetical protein